MIKIINLENANCITHGGIFHADEVFATCILERVLGEVRLCRTFKVPEELGPNVVVYDIGKGHFDHHQKGGNGCRENGVPYSSAGLIWKEFGRTLFQDKKGGEDIWNEVDKNLIQGIDAIDNGVMPKAEYPCETYTVSQLIKGFNPRWDSKENSDVAFLKACEIASKILDNVIQSAISKAKAKEIVEVAIRKSENHIMVLEQFAPWQDYVFDSENKKAGDILYVIFPSNRGGYNLQCVPDLPGSFTQRKSLPKEWRGLNGKELQEVTGVQDATFVHPAGFIGGADSLDGAMKLAMLAVKG